MNLPPTQYRILLNVTRGSQFNRLEKGASLELSYVAYIPLTTDTVTLEDIFRIHNIEHPDNYLARSLSTGDVVTLASVTRNGLAYNFRSYAVNSFGYTKLPETIFGSGIYDGATVERNI